MYSKSVVVAITNFAVVRFLLYANDLFLIKNKLCYVLMLSFGIFTKLTKR